MSSSISNFIHTMDTHSGFSKPDRFLAQFNLPLPMRLGYGSSSNGYDLTFQCHSTELPGVQLHTNTYKTYGPGRTIPVVKIYNEITFSFYCTNDFYEKPLFDTWIDYINPEGLGWDFRYKDEYVTNIVISQLGLADDLPIFSATILRAYPTAVYPMAVSWSRTNTIHSLDVTFMYQTYTITTPLGNIDSLFTTTNDTIDSLF